MSEILSKEELDNALFLLNTTIRGIEKRDEIRTSDAALRRMAQEQIIRANKAETTLIDARAEAQQLRGLLRIAVRRPGWTSSALPPELHGVIETEIAKLPPLQCPEPHLRCDFRNEDDTCNMSDYCDLWEEEFVA